MIKMELNDIQDVMELRKKGVLTDDAVEKAIRKIVSSDVIVSMESKLGRRPNKMTRDILAVLNSVDSITTIDLANRIGVTTSGSFYRTLDYVARRYNLLYKVIKVRRPYKHRQGKVVRQKDRYAKARERMAWIGAKTSNLVKNRGIPRKKAMKIACARWKKIFKGE
jgi:hypothetical protein